MAKPPSRGEGTGNTQTAKAKTQTGENEKGQANQEVIVLIPIDRIKVPEETRGGHVYAESFVLFLLIDENPEIKPQIRLVIDLGSYSLWDYAPFHLGNVGFDYDHESDRFISVQGDYYPGWVHNLDSVRCLVRDKLREL